MVDARVHDPGYGWRNDTLAVFRPLRDSLSRSALLVLDDFAASYQEASGFTERERAHDRLVAPVRDAARAFLRALTEDRAFLAFVGERFANVGDPDSIVRDVAQDIVNNRPRTINAKPGSYRASWNEAMEHLGAFQSSAEARALRKTLDVIEHDSSEAAEWLRGVRRGLVEAFDLPPAPLGL